MRTQMQITALFALAGSAILAQPGLADEQTGPLAQRVPWRAPGGGAGSTLNSVVEVFGAGLGTGTVIGKRQDNNGNGWLCVLTADHVVRGAANVSVAFGDAMGQGTYGGPGASQFRQIHPNLDAAVAAVNVGNLNGNPALAGFFNSLTPVTLGSVQNAGSAVNQQFTELGYGGSGTFVVGGMQANTTTPVAPYSLQIDNNKRFQNNQIERTVRVTGGNYTYNAIQFDMDRAMPPGHFLDAEGISFAGDSGGPYFMSGADAQAVGAFDRPDDADGTFVPDWPGGVMSIFNNMQFAVHTMGNSTPGGAGGAPSRFNGYDVTTGAGLPLTPNRVLRIQRMCGRIPSPGSTALVGIGSIIAFRRRR